ncbi:MAG: hypothetical protein WDO56_11170 [Gammaproteobacteria bacterium]
MHHPAVSRVLITALVVLSMASVAPASAAPTPVVALPNGYYLQPTKVAQTSLVKRGGKAVLPGPVAAYAVFMNVVAGALGEVATQARSYTNDLPFTGKEDTRYFILNTASGQLESNLTEKDWRHRLDELGVPAPFKIYAPLPWAK